MQKINFIPFPIINTQNYLLRKLEISDAPAIFKIRSNTQIAKDIDRMPAKLNEEALQFIIKINEGICNSTVIYWGIESKSNSNIVGTITLWKISKDKESAEIGFELLPNYQSCGIMQEVIPQVIKFGFRVLGLKTIIGEVVPENVKSIMLLKKFGFKFERKLSNTHIYTLFKN